MGAGGAERRAFVYSSVTRGRALHLRRAGGSGVAGSGTIIAAMTARSAILLAAAESFPSGRELALIVAVGLGIIVMLLLIVGRRYRRMVLGDSSRGRSSRSDATEPTADAWAEAAKRVQLSDADADDTDDSLPDRST